MRAPLLLSLIAASGLLDLALGMRPELTRSREGKILAFLALFLLPAAAMGIGFSEHMGRAQSRTFCLSCHVMTDYGRSLWIDDPSYLPARHFQNTLVPAEQACYTCHTNYTMFGTIHAKLRGLRHLYVQYLGRIPRPEDIKLYEPFHNRECLHCHLAARRFEEASAHQRTPDLLPRVKSNQLSCTSSGCHEFIHDVGSLKTLTLWSPAP